MLLLALACHSPAGATSHLDAPLLDVQGTEFVVTLPDGRQRRSAELVGATLIMPSGRVFRIDAVERQSTRSGSEIWLHSLSLQDGDTWRPSCEPDALGQRFAIPFAGSFGEGGRYEAAPGLFNLSCSYGAQAKCLRLGYGPWLHNGEGKSLAPLYNACIRMIRADYCGDSQSHTVDGTLIDLYDDFGIQPGDGDEGMSFEAGWNADGAVCVSHVRIPGLPDPRQSTTCSRLASTPTGQECTETWARRHGAVLFNRSR